MQVNGKILEHREVAKGIFLLKMSVPEIAADAVAGQFIHIRSNSTYDPLLRRPFSISAIDRNAGTLSIVYEVRGKGTSLMAGLAVGGTLDIMGPLGNGFQMPGPGNEYDAILIGGGVGAAPMVALAQALANRGSGEVKVLLGALSKEKLFPQDLFAAGRVRVFVATDDGSQGHKGLVTEMLPSVVSKNCKVFACGPRGMLKAVAEYCLHKDLACQLSMEAFMACGVGACQGCACKVRGETGEGYSRVCKDGPVFKAREVVWDD